MDDDSWCRDILDAAETAEPVSTGADFAAFQRRVDQARDEFLLAIGRHEPLPELEPAEIPETDQRRLARLRW